MPDNLETFMLAQKPTPRRPLLGITVLVVEDSLYACEAMRLLCLRSGARIRRADSLKSAHRHLSAYSPVVAIIDLGLPDGSGVDLIRDLAHATPRLRVILGISGDAGAEALALAAGADGFLAKPIVSLPAFQAAVLAHLPAEQHPRGPRVIENDTVSPDAIALCDDLSNISGILTTCPMDENAVIYVAQFLAGLARLTRDEPLARAAGELGATCRRGLPVSQDLAHISVLVEDRLRAQKTI